MAVIEKREGKRGVRWRAMIRVKPYKSVSKTFKRLTDARRWADKTELELREGRYTLSVESEKHTLGEAIERYEATVLPGIRRSKREYIIDWWKAELGDHLLKDITTSLIVEYRDRIATEELPDGKKRAAATVVRYLSTLSHICSVVVGEWQWMEVNPVLNVSKPSLPRGRVRFLDEDERLRLLDACQESSNQYLYTIVVLAISCGMRKSEIMNLRWSDVDLQKGKITLYETKNNEIRVVSLSSHALDLVNDLDKKRRLDTTLLFAGNDPERPIDFRSAWRVALKKSGVCQFTFHDLRHSCASYLVMNGASLVEVAEVLGHRGGVAMAKRYAHLSEEHCTKVLSSMNEKIFGGG